MPCRRRAWDTRPGRGGRHRSQAALVPPRGSAGPHQLARPNWEYAKASAGARAGRGSHIVNTVASPVIGALTAVMIIGAVRGLPNKEEREAAEGAALPGSSAHAAGRPLTGPAWRGLT